MALEIEFFDLRSLSLYALFFNESDEAFKQSTSGFASYTDSSVGDFDVPLPEEANRVGRYATSVTGTIPKGTIQVEIYEQSGGSPDKAVDTLRGVDEIYWNGLHLVDHIGVSNFEKPSHIGTTDLDEVLYFFLSSFDEFNLPTDTDTSPSFQVFANSTGMADVSGLMVNVEAGLYSASFTVTSGTFNFSDFYSVKIEGVIEGNSLQTHKTFDIASPVTVDDINVDVLGQLGYISGVVQAGSSTTVITTNLTSSVDNFHNGSVARIDGQARIVLDYNGSSKAITVNKAYTFTPASGAEIIIYPIGGELGVS